MNLMGSYRLSWKEMARLDGRELAQADWDRLPVSRWAEVERSESGYTTRGWIHPGCTDKGQAGSVLGGLERFGMDWLGTGWDRLGWGLVCV